MIRLPLDADRVPLAILAAGDYPVCGIALSILERAEKVVCCDGAAAEYIANGGRPFAIVGDCDSLSEELRVSYADIVHCSPDQQTNDLTKAVEFCAEAGFGDVVILGGVGKREDHTIANISLLAEYVMKPGIASVRMVTDRAVFDAVAPTVSGSYADKIAQYKKNGLFPTQKLQNFIFESFAGQQVSIFTPIAGVRITTHGLLYPLEDALLNGWWSGTLNESASGGFSIETTGPVVIYRLFA